MSLPKLYIFPISHYCEKARWALDYLGVDSELLCLAPGAHAQLAEKLGAKASSLPFLVCDQDVVQGSGAIIDWAEACAGNGRSLVPSDVPSVVDIERRLNDVLGVHVRRMYYSEALVEYPDTVLPIFADYLTDEESEFVSGAWEFIAAAMVDRMDLGLEQGQASRQIVLEHFDWLDSMLAGESRYLAGDCFSRVDLTAAALLAPLVMPPEHPTYAFLQVPPGIAKDIAEWRERPVSKYVASMYCRHRSG